MEVEEGDLEDFETWYRQAHPRLVVTVLWIAGDVDQANEAVDEACARTLARWKRVRRMASPTGWTYQVAVNVWRRSQRRNSIEQRLLRKLPPPALSIEGPASETWELVRDLPLRERTAVALRYVADLTETQIGEAMGVRRSTVSVLLSRAHERLGRLIREQAQRVER